MIRQTMTSVLFVALFSTITGALTGFSALLVFIGTVDIATEQPQIPFMFVILAKLDIIFV